MRRLAALSLDVGQARRLASSPPLGVGVIARRRGPLLAGEGAEQVFQKAGARAAAGQPNRAQGGEGERDDSLRAASWI